MNELADDLHRIGIRKVIFTGPTPHWTKNLPQIVFKLWDQNIRRTLIGLNKKIIQNDENISKYFHNDKFTKFISLINYFCNKNGCLIYIGEDLESGITSWDYGHLTPAASDALSRDVLAKAVIDVN